MAIDLAGPDRIVVCPLRLMPALVDETGARDVVSVVNPHLMPPTPRAIAPGHHLKLALSDHGDPLAGERHPAVQPVGELIAFARTWGRAHPLIVHCFSGLTRSTAAAFIILAALNEDVPPPLIALRLRESSDTAAPNRVMVAVADQILGRKGAMIGAIEVIGFGQPAAEGRPFTMPATFHEAGSTWAPAAGRE